MSKCGIRDFTEDTLVQQTTADYLERELGWRSVYAYNQEDFGPDSLLGRTSDREVVLTRILREKLVELNPGLPDTAYDDAVRQITAPTVTQTLVAANREAYRLLKERVPVTYRNADGELETTRLRIIDFDDPDANDFLCVRELWVYRHPYHRRADIVGFVNGLPLLFMELKNVHRDLKTAYVKNFADYKDTIPHLFTHNAVVLLGNGVEAKIGSLTAPYEHFHGWTRLAEEAPGVVDMETLLKGICDRATFLDLVENFILFDDSSGAPVKILARNHQYLGVNRAFAAIRDRKARRGKLGVFWHTQGAGKSYSMVMLTRKVHRKLGGNFTFVMLTDRDDLDTQLYKTFAGCGVVDNDREPCRAANGDHLLRLLAQQKSYVFTLIQKFNHETDPDVGVTQRDDIIVITDEAHRTQYGTLALNMRNALPNAGFMGFTGTPLFKDDEITRRVFGEYVSTYDFQRAVDDKATVPLFYDARGEKLKFVDDAGKAHTLAGSQAFNARIAETLEAAEAAGELEDVDTRLRLERELQRDYHVMTAEKRLAHVAQDLVEHMTTGWENGKAMLVCLDKLTCVRMHVLITTAWDDKLAELRRAAHDSRARTLPYDKATADELARKIAWMAETQIAVVVSEEQGEVGKFRDWGLDIVPHRTLIKDGMDLPEAMQQKPEYASMQRLPLDEAFKAEEHPFRLAIVCAMWLTGFDVPSLGTLYLDKPLKAHTLMQAIARANRVNEGKHNGLIVDYCGILKQLREALATFATGGPDNDGDGTNPVKPDDALLQDLAAAIAMVRDFLKARSAPLQAIIDGTGFARNAAILAAKEAANETDETRKRFEVMCREVFKTFKACLTLKGVNAYREAYGAINVVYKSLQADREKADITDILKTLQGIVDDAIGTATTVTDEQRTPYDISKIDFDRLKEEFARSPAKRTTVQNLKQAIEARLQRMLARNPLRMDLQTRYQEIIDAYNREKDRATIEATFEALLRFVESLDQEETRAMREGLDEESLAVFDLLAKPGLTPAESKRIKALAAELLATLKREKLRVDHWQDKEATRDAVWQAIFDYLYSDRTGLPTDTYTDDDVKLRTDEVYQHVFQVYPTVPSPYYAEVPTAG